MPTSATFAFLPACPSPVRNGAKCRDHFLQRDFWTGIAREHAVTHGLACDCTIGAPDTELIYDPQEAHFLGRTIDTTHAEKGWIISWATVAAGA